MWIMMAKETWSLDNTPFSLDLPVKLRLDTTMMSNFQVV